MDSALQDFPDLKVLSLELVANENGTPYVTLERVSQRDGPERWAVRRDGSALGRDGYFTYEPRPSARDEAFYANYRFPTVAEAIGVWRFHLSLEIEPYERCRIAPSASGNVKPPADVNQRYVAQHRKSKLYVQGMQLFLVGNSAWLDATRPSAATVAKCLEGRECWTDSLNRADIWTAAEAERYQRYLDDVSFVPVTLDWAAPKGSGPYKIMPV